MISFDFDYHKPGSIQEAFNCFQHILAQNKKPIYYAGGTEIISMAKASSIAFDAVIDLKGIPECNESGIENGSFSIGCCQTLTEIAQSDLYPLMAKTAKRVADHTIQGKITIGGNIAGTIKYREASLPLMINDCQATIITKSGLAQIPFKQIFDGKLRLEVGEFLVSISIDERDLRLPHVHVKRTKMDKIDYPLITMAATKDNKNVRAAISGYGEKPLLLPSDILSDSSFDTEKKIKLTIQQIREECKSDLSGSREYREFVLCNIVEQMFQNFDYN